MRISTIGTPTRTALSLPEGWSVFAAAARLFAAEGPGVSMRAIAEAAGVGSGTLYQHFLSREDRVAGLVHRNLAKTERAAADFRGSTDPVADR